LPAERGSKTSIPRLERRTPVNSLVLDTNVWVWWVTQPDRLSRTQRDDRADAPARAVALLLSVIPCWEVALLVRHGRLRFTLPVDVWLERATALPLEVVPLSLPIIVSAARLMALRDPADMLIVATAQRHGARLVTGDTRIEDAALVPVVV
jgi:PIN domain nuclease of toxin-antitoxin system